MHIYDILFFLECFEIAIYDRHTQQDTSSTSHGSHEISSDRQCSCADSSESGSNRDVSIQVLVLADISLVSFDWQVLLFQLLQDVFSSLATDFNPLSAEQGTSTKNEHDVEQDMDRVSDEFRKVLRWADVIGQTSNRYTVSTIVQFLPLAQQSYQNVASEFLVK